MKEIPLTKGSVFLQEGLIHRTKNGRAVRSKSEVIIGNELTNAGILWEYEAPLTLNGRTRYPDFTIEDDVSGRTYYWEHLGLLHRDDYKQGWEVKLAWYETNGVLRPETGAGEKGTLIITRDQPNGGLDTAAIEIAIKQISGQ